MLVLCSNATGSLVETTFSTNVGLHCNLEISCKEISINQSYREVSSKLLISYRKSLTEVIEIFYNLSKFRRNLSRSWSFRKPYVIEILWTVPIEIFSKLSKSFGLISYRKLSVLKVIEIFQNKSFRHHVWRVIENM